MSRLPKETVTKMIDAYIQGSKPFQISMDFGVEESNVRYHLINSGFYKKGPSPKRRIARPETAFDGIGCDSPSLAIYSAEQGLQYDLRSASNEH